MATTYEFAFFTVYKRVYPIALNNYLPIIVNKEYKNILADEHIKCEWIDKLLEIKRISLFSLFSGIDRHFITHLIFLIDKLNDDKCANLINSFNSTKKYQSLYINDIKKTFICLATRNWYRSESKSKLLFEWWENIPNIISEVIK